MDRLLMSDTDLLIVGLGNDEKKYTHTYHNVGFLCIDYIKEQNSSSFQKKNIPSKKQFSAWESFEKNRYLFAKPHSFMNTSGPIIKEALSFFSLSPQQLIVVHDDSDIALGTYKISYNRSDGGHKGISSVIHSLNTSAFYRIRIGIRPEDETQRSKALDMVLSPISKKHTSLLESVYQKIFSLFF